MRFLRISSKIYVSAAVFYSTFSLPKCRAGDSQEFPWRYGNEFVHIYRTEVPEPPIEPIEHPQDLAFVVLVVILSLVVTVAFIQCLIYVCSKLCSKLNSSGQPSGVVPLPSGPEAIVVSLAGTSVDSNGSQTTTNSINRNGHLQDSITYPPTDGGLPEYSAVVAQISPNDRPTDNACYPLVRGAKTVETPPPAYNSVAPFQ